MADSLDPTMTLVVKNSGTRAGGDVGETRPQTTRAELVYPWLNPTKLADPATLPVDVGTAATWSPNGQFLIVGFTSSPRMHSYDRAGTTFTKDPDPGLAIPGPVNGAAFRPGGRLSLALAVSVNPYIQIQTREGASGLPWNGANAPGSAPPGPAHDCDWSPQGNILAVAHETTPFITNYEINDTLTFTPLTAPGTLPTGNGRGCAFSPDGRFLAVAHATSPFVTIYERAVFTFTKLTNPGTLPTGDGRGCAFSPDGRFLAVAHDTTPFITIYERSGTTFTKLADPGTLPAGPGYAVDFSPDGRFLAVGHNVTPFITIYERSGTTFTKLADPGTLPTGNGRSCAFSPDGRFLAVGYTVTPFVTIYRTSGGFPPEGGLVRVVHFGQEEF